MTGIRRIRGAVAVRVVLALFRCVARTVRTACRSSVVGQPRVRDAAPRVIRPVWEHQVAACTGTISLYRLLLAVLPVVVASHSATVCRSHGADGRQGRIRRTYLHIAVRGTRGVLVLGVQLHLRGIVLCCSQTLELVVRVCLLPARGVVFAAHAVERLVRPSFRQGVRNAAKRRQRRGDGRVGRRDGTLERTERR